ncbi:REP element-mobilizing transposase RayT [Mesobacillus persicus]|uniref:REP element-mobilizing transposase RayT n=1 Tax=Mesobacillus persicus TaxID=930146 RepID=A0A1H8G0N8_9BACI|nr:transposase [Mesobacillus persicus]SEN37512.1 REP element-mobilizing transposase RayT [Mesobacillus persicus]
MARGPRVKSESGIYHVIWKGANRQELFHDEEDSVVFFNFIAKYKVRAELKVFAWCFMSNHVHLLLKEGNEDLAVTLKRLGVSYVLYYNRKYDTTGHLFQDRYRSRAVEDVGYLLRVIRYIHQNPVKAGLINRVDDWKWSSCQDYYDFKNGLRKLVDRDFVYELFSDQPTVAKEKFKEFNELAPSNQDDSFLDEGVKKRLTDDEARIEIKNVLGLVEIAQVKGLPRLQRDEALRKIKKIKGVTQRQASRIVGVSVNLIYKA